MRYIGPLYTVSSQTTLHSCNLIESMILVIISFSISHFSIALWTDSLSSVYRGPIYLIKWSDLANASRDSTKLHMSSLDISSHDFERSKFRICKASFTSCLMGFCSPSSSRLSSSGLYLWPGLFPYRNTPVSIDLVSLPQLHSLVLWFMYPPAH